MPVTITFHRINEKKPKDGESIIYLQKQSQFGFTGFAPGECDVEYSWLGTGEFDGCQIGHNGESEMEGYELKIIFGSEFAEDDDLWVGVDDYWDCFT